MPEALFSEFPAATYANWLEAAERSLDGQPIERLVARTREGLRLEPLPSAADLRCVEHQRSLPGQFPFVRGAAAAMYRGRPWLITAEIDVHGPREWNLALREALEGGQSAVVIGDSPRLRSVEDLRLALADIDLGSLPLFIQHGAPVAEILRWLPAVMSRKRLAALRGCLGSDPLGELARTGAMPADALDQLAERCRRLGAFSPGLGSVAVDTEAYHAAGADAAQELAIALATGVACLRALIERGLSLESVAGSMHFFLQVGERFFTEVAKFRAFRLLWAQALRAFRHHGDGLPLALHARAGRRNKAHRDPHVNLLRLTSEAFAAALGGVDSIQLPAYSADLESDAESRRLSRNIQLILQEELRLTELLDPAGGSYHLESLTDQLARAAWTRFQAIEAGGGMLASLRAGAIQDEIESVAQARLRDFMAGETVLVGLNAFAKPNEPAPSLTGAPAPEPSLVAAKSAIRARPLQPLPLAEAWEAAREPAR